MTKGFRLMSTATRAIVVGSLMLGLSTSPAFAKKKEQEKAAESESSIAPSKEYLKVYKEIVEANTAKDPVALQAALAKAEPLATKPDDHYLQGMFGLQLGLFTKDLAKQATSLDMMLDSGVTPATELAKFNYFSGSFAYNAKDFPKAIRRLEAATAAGSTEPSLSALLMDSYLKTDQLDKALAVSKAGVASARAAGTVPMDDLYVRPAQALMKAGRTDEMLDVLAMRLEDYPSPDIWRNTLYIHLKNNAGDKELALDIFRLMRATKAMDTRADYLEYAANATEAGLPGEVISLISEGRANKIIPAGDAKFDEVFKTQSARASGEKAALMGDVAKAASLPDSKRARSSGDALFGMGEYAGAITLYQAALNLPGARPDVINYRLGQAQAKSGNLDAAVQSFAKVTGPRKRIADLWLIHIKHKQAPAAAPAAPAAEPATAG